MNCRSHAASLTDFGGDGNGITSNAKAFQAAIDHLSRFSLDGGSLLFVPPGKWLTGSFNLTSHFTLIVHKDAVLLVSQAILTYLKPFLSSIGIHHHRMRWSQRSISLRALSCWSCVRLWHPQHHILFVSVIIIVCLSLLPITESRGHTHCLKIRFLLLRVFLIKF